MCRREASPHSHNCCLIPPVPSQFCFLVCSAATMFSNCFCRAQICCVWALSHAFKGESYFCGVGLLLLFEVVRMHNLWHVCMSLINWGKRRCQNAKMKCNRSPESLRTVHQLLAFVYRVKNPMKVCRICWTKLEETPSRCCTSADPAAISRATAVRQLFSHRFKGHEIWF